MLLAWDLSPDRTPSYSLPPPSKGMPFRRGSRFSTEFNHQNVNLSTFLGSRLLRSAPFEATERAHTIPQYGRKLRLPRSVRTQVSAISRYSALTVGHGPLPGNAPDAGLGMGYSSSGRVSWRGSYLVEPRAEPITQAGLRRQMPPDHCPCDSTPQTHPALCRMANHL